MKARVKATGKIVDATYWNTSANGIKYYDIDNSGNTMMEDELDFDFSYTPDYWTKLEHQYAGMVLLGLSTRGAYGKEEIIADYCYDTAHALVEKMKNQSV